MSGVKVGLDGGGKNATRQCKAIEKWTDAEKQIGKRMPEHDEDRAQMKADFYRRDAERKAA